jgi:hypothetical protein
LRLKVVVHFNEFVRLTPLCLGNADRILVSRQWPRNGLEWDATLWEATGIPRDCVEASTCDLVGVEYNYSRTKPAMEFVEVHCEEEISRARILDRCTTIAEELMRASWHPDRMCRRLLEDPSCYADAM